MMGSNATTMKPFGLSVLVALFVLLCVPAMAQQPQAAVVVPLHEPVVPPNAPTRAVLIANCPKDMAEADWLRPMAMPVNRSLYPLRLTQGTMDTIDARLF